jgi:glycosyltransferase involved in cell wall biosynthesis
VNSCHIVPSLEARHGGPSKSVLGLAGALARGGNEVEVLATEDGPGGRHAEGRLHVRTFHREWPETVCGSSGLRSYLGTVRADVIHHHSIWLRTLHYAHETARHIGAPFVVSPRGMMSPWAWKHHSGRKAVARALIHPGAFEAADGWHATSDGEAASLRDLGFRQPVCVAPNGVTAPSPDEASAAAAHWRECLPAAGQRPVALFYSRFHRKKRLLELIDAWLALAPRDWLLLAVGIPEDYTVADLERKAQAAGASDRVVVLDGAGHPPPYGIASLFLLPSHSENFGLSIAEALAHGVPALVTDSTPWAALNGNGAGWCVPWPDYGAALRAATAEDPGTLRKRGAAGREWVLRTYSWEISARLLSEFYAGLRSGAPARSA